MLSQNKPEIIVDFRDKKLKIDSKNDAQPIIKALSITPKMTTLRLSGNTIGVDGADEIGSNLSAHKNLSKCLLSDTFTSRMAEEIAPALKHISRGIMASGAQLTELDLSDNAFGPRGVVGVTELLSSSACFTLKILRMNNQGLGHAGAKHLADALSEGIKSSSGKGLKLQHFSAGRNRLENVGACLLADVFSKMGSLEELNLYQNGIGIHGPDGIKALTSSISQNTKMRVLNLSDNSLKETGCVDVAKILPSLPELQEIILDDCLIRSVGCRALSRQFQRETVVPHLSRLSLCGNEIRRSAGIGLAISFGSKPNLKSLGLNGNDFGGPGIESVISALKSVNLINALEAAAPGPLESDDSDQDVDAEKMDACHRAFNEDQGSETEDDDESTEADYEENGDYGESGDDYEEETEDRENYYSAAQQHPDGSLNESDDSLVNGAPALSLGGPSGFSFLSCMSNLQTQSPLAPTSLFAGLDNKDASASRNRLFWQAPQTTPGRTLFGHTPPAAAGGILTPPVLGNLSNFDADGALEALKAALSDPENDDLVYSVINNLTNASWYPQIDVTSSPESVVRLAFRLAHISSSPAPRRLAIHLLLAACTAKNLEPTAILISPRGRAVNRVLGHLGSIKVDRSDSVDRRIVSELPVHLPASVDLVTDLLSQHGEELSKEVKATLMLLISEKMKSTAGQKAESLDAILEALQRKMSHLGVS